MNRLWKSYTPVLLFLAAIFLAGTIQAQQSFVPQVIATPGSPSTVLYGLYHGNLVRSTDLGATWIPLYISTPGLPQPPVQGFDINQLDANTIYLATSVAAGAFWKSTDAGNTWAKSNVGLPASGGTVDYFKQVLDSGTVYLYLKIGNGLYKSADGGATWILQGTLPGSNGRLEIAEARRAWMYYVDPATLSEWFSGDEGHSFNQTPYSIPAALQNATITGMGVLYYNPAAVFVSVDGVGTGQGAYYINVGGAGAFTDASAIGLGPFTKILSYTTGPTYALTPGFNGTYRSTDGNGAVWNLSSATGDRYGVTAVDPIVRTTVYGVKIAFGGTAPTAFAVSTDSGDHWTVQSANITPTIAQPVPAYNITLEAGAPYAVTLNLQTLEDPAWVTPVTVSTSGESWISLSAASGSTPFAETMTISTAGLTPGAYTSLLTISAPQTRNKVVTVPVNLTVVPLGSLGAGYVVSTVAGSGSLTDSRTSGQATSLGIGAAKALAFDGAGNLLISSGSRIWQLAHGNLNALAGNGTDASAGDGPDPLAASIADPDAIALDSAANIYFSEYSTERVRKLSGGVINTVFDATKTPNNTVANYFGSHSLLFDSANREVLTSPGGLFRYDGLRLTNTAPFSFTDPYSTVADASGNLYISDRGSHQIFKMTPGAGISVAAGSGLPGFAGDGGPASLAVLNKPMGLAMDAQGTLYIADSGNQRIRTITPDGKIHTIAGSGIPGFSGDGLTGDFAAFRNPEAVAVDAKGDIFVADSGNNRVRMLVLQSTPNQPPPPSVPQPRAIAGPNGAQQLSPGSIFQLYGTLLSTVTAQVATAPWPTSMAGVAITINGTPVPLYYVSPTQINGQIPFETAPGSATLSITSNGSAAATLNFTVVPAQPDLLVQGGGTQAVAVNQDGTVNSANTPAHPGDIEVLYLTGIGVPTVKVATGAASPTSPPFALVAYPYAITVGGQQTVTYFLGYAPGYPALVQANFQIPPGLAPGDYQVVVTVNGSASIPATISVR